MFYHEWKYNIHPKKFDDIDLNLFKNFRITTLLGYIFCVWFLLILKICLLISDFYTCIKLLAYNSWSSNVIKPFLPFNISKWIFSSCILLSTALILWEVIFGIRVSRTRNIALCYVNKFSRLIYSVSNYSKFCVFNRISSKTTFEKFAFFVFFELKDCIGLLLADTPRQVINALTLWSVLITTNDSDLDLGDLQTFDDVLNRIRYIANSNHQEAVLLSVMLCSFIIWLFFMIKLIFAFLCTPFVFYKLIKNSKYSTLREFTCISISSHIDDLVERQKEKIGRIESVRTPILSDQFEFDDLDLESRYEITEYKGPQYTTQINNLHQTSMDSFFDNDSNNESGDKSFDLFNSNDSQINILNKPQRVTSVIYDVNAKILPYIPNNIKHNNIRTRPKPNLGVDTSFSTSHSEIFNHIFTPKKAYFRGDDYEQSSLLKNNNYEQFIWNTSKK